MNEIQQFSKVDFHVHYTPETGRGIVDEASEKGMRAVALISRAGMYDNLPDLIDYGESKNLEVIPGVEMVVSLGDLGDCEIIALGFKVDNQDIQRLWGEASNVDKNVRMAVRQRQMFEENGFNFNGLDGPQKETLESIMRGEINEKAIRFCEIIVNSKSQDNLDLIDQLIDANGDLWDTTKVSYSKKEYYKDRKDRLVSKFLYELYFGPNKVGRKLGYTKIDEVLDRVHGGGGIVVYSPEGKYDKKVWDYLSGIGIDGIMAWHGGLLGNDHGSQDIPLEDIVSIRNEGKLILGGSDFDPNKRDWSMAVGSGNMFISERRYEEYKRYKEVRMQTENAK